MVISVSLTSAAATDPIQTEIRQSKIAKTTFLHSCLPRAGRRRAAAAFANMSVVPGACDDR
jgi:hypothetical protein